MNFSHVSPSYSIKYENVSFHVASTVSASSATATPQSHLPSTGEMLYFDTDCLMMVYFHVVSVSASTTAQSPSTTLSSPLPTGELTVGACHDVYSVCLCRH